MRTCPPMWFEPLLAIGFSINLKHKKMKKILTEIANLKNKTSRYGMFINENDILYFEDLEGKKTEIKKKYISKQLNQNIDYDCFYKCQILGNDKFAYVFDKIDSNTIFQLSINDMIKIRNFIPISNGSVGAV